MIKSATSETSKSNQLCLLVSKRDNLCLELPTILYNVQRFETDNRSGEGSPEILCCYNWRGCVVFVIELELSKIRTLLESET